MSWIGKPTDVRLYMALEINFGGFPEVLGSHRMFWSTGSQDVVPRPSVSASPVRGTKLYHPKISLLRYYFKVVIFKKQKTQEKPLTFPLTA